MTTPPENHDSESDPFADRAGAQPDRGSQDAQPDHGSPEQYGSRSFPDGRQSYGTPQPGAQPYGSGAGQYGATQYGTGEYGADPYGNQQYGSQPYPGEQQPYGGQQYGAQPYGASPYGADPYGNQQYGAPQYGGQPYGAMQPYGYPSAARKDPALMLVASLILPGLGTILNGETGKGIGILGGYVVGALLSVVLIGLPIMFGFWVWGMYDAYQGAKDHNARHGLP